MPSTIASFPATSGLGSGVVAEPAVVDYARTAMRRCSAILAPLLVALPMGAAAEDEGEARSPAAPATPPVAEPTAAPDDPVAPELRLAPRPGSLLATGAAFVPGLLLHGSGHFVLGERQSAYRLLAMEGAGLLGIVGGIGLLAAVGGSEKLAAVYVPLTVSGAGLFGLSFLADVVGAARGRRPWPEPLARSRLGVRAGYVGLFAAKHTFGHLGELGVAWQTRRLVLEAAAMLHPQGDYGAYRGLAGWRFWLPPDDPVTRFTLFAELGHQGFASEGFSLTTFRAFGELRWNLGALLPTMRNAWVLGRLGWGFDSFAFAGTSAEDDGLPFLVADTGLGLAASERVEVELAYRHRKGDLPGGMALSDGMAGFAGMLELRGRVALGARWALLPGVRLGTGVMPWLSLESRLF